MTLSSSMWPKDCGLRKVNWVNSDIMLTSNRFLTDFIHGKPNLPLFLYLLK